MRHATQVLGKDGPVGVGGFKTVDRMGNPAINVALIPFNLKNAYNAGTPKTDALGLKGVTFAAGGSLPTGFTPEIIDTLIGLGTPFADILALANVAITHGDLLQLNTEVGNFGPGGGDHIDAGTTGGGFPNGRRLKDDTIDTILQS